MENFIYVLKIASNVSWENDFENENLKAFINEDDAVAYLNKIAASIANKTCKDFIDREWGWINPIQEEWDWEGKFGIVYRWTHPESGEICYTKYMIDKVELR